MSLFFAFLTAFVFTILLVPVVARVARARGFYAQPSYDRWHRYPVPRIGGVAMFIPLALALALGGLLPQLAAVSVGAGAMFVVGLADDMHALKPGTKLVWQMIVAATVLWLVPSLKITGIPIVDLPLGFLWIVGITNAFNLLDNIDGLAAGVAAIGGTFFLCALGLTIGVTDTPLATAMAAFVGAAFGFLLYNFQPASIFMGDSGSHLLGSFLACATLVGTPAMSSRLAPVAAVPVLLLLIPIFDTTFVTLTRGLAGRSAFLGGRDHTSHRLVALGIGERRAVLVLYALGGLGGLVALGLATLSGPFAWWLVALYVALLGAIGLYLGHVEVARGAVPQGLLPSEITTQHRAYEVVLDLILICAAYELSFLARFRGPEVDTFLPYFARSLPLVAALQLGALWISGKYRLVSTRLTSSDVGRLVQGSLLGVAATVIALLYIYGFAGYSREVFAFDAVFAPVFVVGLRVALSTVDQYLRLRRSRGRTAVIYGAGRGGALALRELLQNPSLGLTPVGFIDDDASKRRLRVDGLPVLGALEDLPALAERLPGTLATLVVSIEALPRERWDRLHELCAVRGISITRMRMQFEDVVRPGQPGSVVRFPGASA